MRVLVVEDEPGMASLLRRGLREEGLLAEVVGSGEDGFAMASSSNWDAFVLDVSLPGMDGFELCRLLRAEGDRTPVLMLTARDAVADRVAGLDSGADDYLRKPFSFDELLARLRALERRVRGRPDTDVLSVGSLRLDPAQGRAWRGKSDLHLSARELALLEAFMRRPGELLSKLHLLEHAWDHSYDAQSNVVAVYVRYLREKIDRPFGVGSIETVRGMGYRLRSDGGV